MKTMELMGAMKIPNNYRRMHGQKPMRWKHIWNAHNKRLKNWQMDAPSFYPDFMMLEESAVEAMRGWQQFLKECAELYKEEEVKYEKETIDITM